MHREWLHRLGNVTLTAYNSRYSDRPFEEKKTIPGGFADSAERLNRFIREQTQWTVTEMELRASELAERALKIWPPFEVSQRAIDAAQEERMRQKAMKRDVSKVPMTDVARALFEELRVAVKQLDERVIEMAETKSVSYHAPDFILEVLPRKNRLDVLVDLDFNELEDTHGIAKDTSEWRFFVNAQYKGGVYIPIDPRRP